QKWRVPIQEDPPGRRDDFVERYFQRAQPDQVVAIIKAREPATYMTAIGKDDRWHLEMKRRWVDPTPLHLEMRSEEHTSELQSRFELVCRLLLEKKNNHAASTRSN